MKRELEKNLSTDLLLRIALMAKRPNKAVFEHYNMDVSYSMDNNLLRWKDTTVNTNTGVVVLGPQMQTTLKAIAKEVKERKLIAPIPAIPPNGKMIFKPLDIEPVFKNKTSLIVPDKAKDNMSPKELKYHLLQGVVVALGKDVNYNAVKLGSKIYLTNVVPDGLVYDEEFYVVSTVAIIGAVVY